jgi:hypothetical protein
VGATATRRRRATPRGRPAGTSTNDAWRVTRPRSVPNPCSWCVWEGGGGGWAAAASVRRRV